MQDTAFARWFPTIGDWVINFIANEVAHLNALCGEARCELRDTYFTGVDVIESTNDLMIDGSRTGSAERVESYSDPNGFEAGYLSEQRFNQLTEELIYTATAGGVLPSDALAALAKAMGVLAAFTARREKRALAEILCASQETVESFATAAETFMDSDPQTK